MDAITPTRIKLIRPWAPIDDQGRVLFTIEPGVYTAVSFRLLGKQGFVDILVRDKLIPDVPTRYMTVLEY